LVKKNPEKEAFSVLAKINHLHRLQWIHTWNWRSWRTSSKDRFISMLKEMSLLKATSKFWSVVS